MPTKSRSPIQFVAIVLCALWISAAANPSRATEREPADASDAAEQSLRLFIEHESRKLPGRVEVEFGQLNTRLRLAPCQRIEPHLPPGMRLWGRIHVGLRCVEGEKPWNVYLPVHIRVFVPALIAARPLSAGQALTEDDVRTDEVDLTREAAGVLTDQEQIADRVPLRAVPAGAALRADMFRARPVVAQGDQVKVVFKGEGFTVAAEGKALAPAGVGQLVRVQMESGRVVSGTATSGRQVELR